MVIGDGGRQLSSTDLWMRMEMRWGKVAGNSIQRAIGGADISLPPQVSRQVSRYTTVILSDNFLKGF